MDIDKFRGILESKAIYFCSAKKFSDPFEGEFAWGRKGYNNFIETQRKLLESHGGGMPFDLFMTMNLKTLKEMSESTFISCWHSSEHESEAMWKLYCNDSSRAVVIKTTRNRLAKQLANMSLPGLQLKDVKYTKNFWIKQYNPEKEIFYTKRAAFEHEKEFRAFFHRYGAMNTPPKHGELVPVDVQQLVSEIRISPFADPSLLEEVNELLSSHNLKCSVGHSEIETHPIFHVEEHIISSGSNWNTFQVRLATRNT